MADDDPRIEDLLGRLTLEEKASLTAGEDMWHTPAVERVGLGRLKVSDGPAGCRGGRFTASRSTSFPCGTALGATWDVDLVRRVGEALGEETRAKGAHVLLAPTVNLHRTPLAGRSFECHSEDPHLGAGLAVAYVEGVQSRGVGCAIKHFVCNDQETERMTIDADVDERTRRELYLAPFEAAVRRAGVWSVMAAYNRLDGLWCSEHPGLLDDLLNGEWGFDGLVMSDWFGTHSTGALAAGLDLEMPGPATALGHHVVEAVERGEVDEADLDDAVRRLLRLMARTGALEGGDGTESSDPVPGSRALAREAATAGIVLLRNDGVLPLDPAAVARLAVLGPNADLVEVQGGGSAQVNPHHVVTPVAGLAERFADLVHEPGVSIAAGIPALDPRRLSADGEEGFRLEYVAGGELEGEIVLAEHASRTRLVWLGDPGPGLATGGFSVRASARFTPDVTGPWRFALTSAGATRLLLDGEVVVDNSSPTRGPAFFGMGSTEVTGDLDLVAGAAVDLVVELHAAEGLPLAGVVVGAAPPLGADPVGRAVAAAAEADVAVVVVGLNSDWETEGRDRADLALPGGQDDLVRRVAAANPRTVVVVNAGAPVLMPWADDVAAVVQLWYPGEAGGEALADVLTGVVSPSGRLPVTFPRRDEDVLPVGRGGTVTYDEGLGTGYRRRGVEPLFPFGHGLSYTTFAYGSVDVAVGEEGVEVSVEVTNTGGLAGAEVVQVYLRGPGYDRPDRELEAFAKVHLDAGEARVVRLPVDLRGLAVWDDGWVVEPGRREVLIGASVGEPLASAAFDWPARLELGSHRPTRTSHPAP